MGIKQIFPFPYFLIFSFIRISLSELVASRIYSSFISTPALWFSTFPYKQMMKCLKGYLPLQIISSFSHSLISDIWIIFFTNQLGMFSKIFDLFNAHFRMLNSISSSMLSPRQFSRPSRPIDNSLAPNVPTTAVPLRT